MTFLRFYFLLSMFCFNTWLPASAQYMNCKTVLRKEGVELAYPRLSADNRKVLYQSNESGKWQIMMLDLATGKAGAVTRDTFNNNFPDWSRDRQYVSFVSDRDGNEEVYIMNLENQNLQNISNDAGRDIHPYFSPDGKFILFNSTRGNGSFDIYRFDMDTREIVRLTSYTDNETCARYSSDMKSIVYLRNGEAGDDVYVLDAETFLSTNITNTPTVRDGWPMFSADGKWIYYSSMETGIYNIYRMKPDGKEKVQLTQAAQGEEDARVYISDDSRLLVYNKRKGKTIEIDSCALNSH